jgi:S-adenosylmethionine/arginine decarboxylase-like enzyme
MAMWWGVATLTTVGYGDVHPVTAIGKVLGAIIAVLGIGLFALPAGLIGGAYLEEVEERKNRKRLKGADPNLETPIEMGEGKSRHLMLDIWLKQDIDQASLDHILNLVRNQFTILHEFEHTFTPHGYTKGFILSESHFFLHTYPESRFLSIDLYVCNPDVDLEALTRMFLSGLEVEHEAYQIVFRGV